MIPLPAILKILVLLWPLKLEELLKTLEDPTNPIYLSIFFVAIFFFVIFLFYKYLINPSISQYKEEKESIELKSAKLMALFAELDPDPVIRIDLEGTIIETNKAAEEVLSQQNLKGKKINKSLPFIDFDLEEAITNNKTKVFT
ncbi:MAG: PAS domain-containing protein, partial [Bacteroidota bacterium]